MDKLAKESLENLLNNIYDIWPEIVEKVIADRIPPKSEFKRGDPVEVRDSRMHNPETWRLRRFKRMSGDSYIVDTDTMFSECRHAPTWIKWEDGPAPKDCKGKGNVWKGGDGRLHIDMYDGRWAWMPE